jgi:hypothetical protein
MNDGRVMACLEMKFRYRVPLRIRKKIVKFISSDQGASAGCCILDLPSDALVYLVNFLPLHLRLLLRRVCRRMATIGALTVKQLYRSETSHSSMIFCGFVGISKSMSETFPRTRALILGERFEPPKKDVVLEVIENFGCRVAHVKELHLTVEGLSATDRTILQKCSAFAGLEELRITDVDKRAGGLCRRTEVDSVVNEIIVPWLMRQH